MVSDYPEPCEAKVFILAELGPSWPRCRGWDILHIHETVVITGITRLVSPRHRPRKRSGPPRAPATEASPLPARPSGNPVFAWRVRKSRDSTRTATSLPRTGRIVSRWSRWRWPPSERSPWSIPASSPSACSRDRASRGSGVMSAAGRREPGVHRGTIPATTGQQETVQRIRDPHFDAGHAARVKSRCASVFRGFSQRSHYRAPPRDDALATLPQVSSRRSSYHDCRGVDPPIAPLILRGFMLMRIFRRAGMRPQRASRPFSRDRDVSCWRSSWFFYFEIASTSGSAAFRLREIAGDGSTCRSVPPVPV